MEMKYLRSPLGILNQRGFVERYERVFLDLKRGFLESLPPDYLMSH